MGRVVGKVSWKSDEILSGYFSRDALIYDSIVATRTIDLFASGEI